MPFIVFYVSLYLLLAVSWKLSKCDVLSPNVLICASFIGAATMYILGSERLEAQTFTAKTTSYLLLGILVFILGSETCKVVVKSIRKYSDKRQYTAFVGDGIKPINLPIFFYVGFSALVIITTALQIYHVKQMVGGSIITALSIYRSETLLEGKSVVLLFMKFGLIGACVAYLAYGTLFRLLGKHYFYKYKGIGENLSKVKYEPSGDEIKEMISIVWHNAWRDGAISLCNYCCNQVSTLICSAYLSLAETGTYSIGVQIASAIATIAGTLYNTYQPELQVAYISADKDKMRKTMSMIVVSFVYLFFLGTASFCVIGIPFLKLIKPSAVVSIPILIGLCVYQFILKYRNCYTSYFSCTNRIIYVGGFTISAILCVGLSFVAIGPLNMGIWGLISAQIISQAVYNLWKWPSLGHKELGLSIKDMIYIGNQETVALLKQFIK